MAGLSVDRVAKAKDLAAADRVLKDFERRSEHVALADAIGLHDDHLSDRGVQSESPLFEAQPKNGARSQWAIELKGFGRKHVLVV